MADGVGFEPTVPFRYSGFQDQCNKPLCQPSVKSWGRREHNFVTQHGQEYSTLTSSPFC